MIEILAWAPTRRQMIQGLVETQLCSALRDDVAIDPASIKDDSAEGVMLQPDGDISLAEIGPITKTPAVYDGSGTEVAPAIVQGGWHVDAIIRGKLAAQLTNQLEAGGTIFESTWLLAMVPSLEPVDGDSANGVKDAFKGDTLTVVYDASQVTTRRHTFA